MGYKEYKNDLSDSKTPIQIRFLKYVQKGVNNSCDVWVGNISKDGYGTFWFKGSKQRAHRISYLLFIDSIPKNMLILHKCDNPLCVNPKHLFIGTQKDNMQDCVSKGRHISHYQDGENNFSHKLTLEQVKNIKRDNRKIKLISEDYNVTTSCIYLIKRGMRWGSYHSV